MAGFTNLKKVITDNIKPNDKNEITGQVLQDVLVTFVNSLNGRLFAGIATPATNPGTPDGNVFYIATEAGTYTYFGGAKLEKGSIGIFTNNSSNAWNIEVLFNYSTPSGDPMHDAYVIVGATWNDNTGYWELNGLTDITNDEMREIYVRGIGSYQRTGDSWANAYSSSNVRTNLWGNTGASGISLSMLSSFYQCNSIEIIQIASDPTAFAYLDRIGIAFTCPKCTTITNPLNVSSCPTEELTYANTFNLPLCTKLYLNKVKGNVNLSAMAVISLDSLTNLVTNASNSGAITVTVHPTIYGYLTDQSGHPDWYALAQTAAGKQISFVSA